MCIFIINDSNTMHTSAFWPSFGWLGIKPLANWEERHRKYEWHKDNEACMNCTRNTTFEMPNWQCQAKSKQPTQTVLRWIKMMNVFLWSVLCMCAFILWASSIYKLSYSHVIYANITIFFVVSYFSSVPFPKSWKGERKREREEAGGS